MQAQGWQRLTGGSVLPVWGTEWLEAENMLGVLCKAAGGLLLPSLGLKSILHQTRKERSSADVTSRGWLSSKSNFPSATTDRRP